MDSKLALLVRVIRRRLANGEEISAVLADYPKLTQEEKIAVFEALK